MQLQLTSSCGDGDLDSQGAQNGFQAHGLIRTSCVLMVLKAQGAMQHISIQQLDAGHVEEKAELHC